MVSTKEKIKDVIADIIIMGTVFFLAEPTIAFIREMIDNFSPYFLNIEYYLFHYEFMWYEEYILQMICVILFGCALLKFGISIIKTYPLEEVYILSKNSRIMINKTTKRFPYVRKLLNFRKRK